MKLLPSFGLLVSASMMWSAAAMGGISADPERGKVVVGGYGEAEHEPEYAQLRVSVTSICYNEAQEAKNANAQLSNQLLSILKSYATGAKEKVYALGGRNFRNTESIGYGSGMKVICENKWRAENNLILETGSLELLPQIQDEILATIDQFELSPELVEQTYAELSQPSFRLYEKTRLNLRAKAQKKAHKDAARQLRTFKGICELENLRIQSITPPQYQEQPIFRAQSAEAPSTTTPIIPQKIKVSANWQFKWSFSPTSACEDR